MENSPPKQEGQEQSQPSILHKLYDIEWTYEEAIQKSERLAAATGEPLEEVVVLNPYYQAYMMTDVYTGLLTELPTGDTEAHKKATRDVFQQYAAQIIYDLVYPSGKNNKLADQYNQCYDFAQALAGHLADGDDLQGLQFIGKERALLTAAATRVHHLWKPYLPNTPIELSLARDPRYPEGYPKPDERYSADLYDQSLEKVSRFYARIARAEPLPGEPFTQNSQGRATISKERAIELTAQRLTNYLFNGVLGALIDPIVGISLTEAAKNPYVSITADQYIKDRDFTFDSKEQERKFKESYAAAASRHEPSIKLLPRYKFPPVRVTIGVTAGGKSTLSLQNSPQEDHWTIIDSNQPFNMSSDDITVMARDGFRPSVFDVPEGIPPDMLPKALIQGNRTNYIQVTNNESAWQQRRAEDLTYLLYTFDTCPLFCLEFVPPQEGSGYRIGALEKFANAQVIQVDVPISVSVLRAEQRARVGVSDNVPYAQVDSNRIFTLSEILKTHRNAGFYVEAFDHSPPYIDLRPYDPCADYQDDDQDEIRDDRFDPRLHEQFLLVSNDVPKGTLLTPMLRYDYVNSRTTIYNLPELLSLGLKKFLRKDLTDGDRQAVLENRPEIYEGGSNDPIRSAGDILQMLRKMKVTAANHAESYGHMGIRFPKINFENAGRLYARISCNPFFHSNEVALEYNPHDALTHSDEFRAVRRLLETTYDKDELTISYFELPERPMVAGLTMRDAAYVARYVDAKEKYHYSPEAHSAAVKAKRRRRSLGKITLSASEIPDVRPSTGTI